MEIDEKIIAEAIKEREEQRTGLLNGKKATITRPDGTQRRPYARLLIQPTIVEVARRYMCHFLKKQGCGDVCNEQLDRLVEKINGELSEESKDFLSFLIMSAFLEGGIFCACGRGIGRREEFINLAMKEGMIDTNPANANKQLELDF